MASKDLNIESSDMDIYRKLQQHLDELPIGYPPTETGVEIRLLKHLFTPEEAKIATMLKFAYKDLEPLESIYERVKPLGYSLEELEKHLDNMGTKGAIIAINEGGKKTYGDALFMVGAFEFQVNKLTREYVEDVEEYFETFAMDMAKVPIAQMRTIPVGFNIEHEANVASYDDIKTIIENKDGPFMIINCVCRQAAELLGKTCKTTSRSETCMGFGQFVKMYLDKGWGREISKDEALEILKKNEEEGLVFQPGNAQKVDFLCSCCSCCCEGLSHIKQLPFPGDIVTSNFYAEIELDLCTGCETCIDRCPMEAISLEDDSSSINRRRCIGCGNCIIVCPSEAIKLHRKKRQHIPPMTEVELYDSIMKAKTKLKERELRRKLKKEKRMEK